MKKNTILLTAIVAAFSAGSILRAADFETELRNVESQLAASKAAPVTGLAGLQPSPIGNKWWSVDFFGSAHKAIAKAALMFINRNTFPDIQAATSILRSGSNDESGHPDPTKNGGDVKALWLGREPFFKGGVMRNYEQFKFQEAYQRLGALCHLTQDQAVPTHAANIKHGTSDSFEGFPGNDVKLSDARGNDNMEPYEYYQAVQDETRGKMPGWTDPATGIPYWIAAPDAPPLGKDATYGPWGHYGGSRNRDNYASRPQQDNPSEGGNNNNLVSAHPEIRLQQLVVAGDAMINVLQSASRRLPPLVQDVSVSTSSHSLAGKKTTGYMINFNIYENRSPWVVFKAYLYKGDELLGIVTQERVTLSKVDQKDIMYSAHYISGWSGSANWGDYTRLPPGDYIIDVRVTDADGNTTPDEVNTDDIPSNDTRVAITID